MLLPLVWTDPFSTSSLYVLSKWFCQGDSSDHGTCFCAALLYHHPMVHTSHSAVDGQACASPGLGCHEQCSWPHGPAWSFPQVLCDGSLWVKMVAQVCLELGSLSKAGRRCTRRRSGCEKPQDPAPGLGKCNPMRPHRSFVLGLHIFFIFPHMSLIIYHPVGVSHILTIKQLLCFGVAFLCILKK